MRSVMINLTAVLALPTMTACGAFETEDSGRKADQVDSGLVGEWKSECDEIGFTGFASVSSRFAFSAAGDFDRETTLASDDACDQPAVRAKILGTYDVVGKAELEDDEKGENINFTITEATLTPLSTDAANTLSDLEYCGVAEWSKNKAVDISEKDCAGESIKVGDVVFDVYRLEDDDDKLLLGESLLWFNKESSDDRPTSLSEDQPFFRED